MSEHTALSRLVEDDRAPIRQRVRALEQIDHPSLAMLRRLLVKTARKKEIPAKLAALASLRYVQELRLKHTRRLQKSQTHDNLLGVQ